MGRVADILTSPEWAEKPALEKAQARRELFEISLEDNPEFREQFEAADDAGKQALVDHWKAEVSRSFPAAFTTRGFEVEIARDGTQRISEATVPVYDIATEQLIARAAPMASRTSLAEWQDDVSLVKDLPEESRRLLTPFLYERFGETDMFGEDGKPLFAKPNDFIQTNESTGKAILRFVVPAAFRIAPPLGASVSRNPKLVAGAAAAGEAAAQSIEKAFGDRQKFSPTEMGLNALLSIVPAASIGKLSNPALNLARRATVRATEGAAQGAFFEAGRQIVDEGDVDASRVAATAAFGAGLGTIVGTLEPRIAAMVAGKTAPEARDALAAAAARASTPEQKAAFADAQRQIEESLRINAEPKSASEAAAILSAEHPPVTKSARESAEVLAAESNANDRRATDFMRARAEEAGQTIRTNQVATGGSIVLGDDPVKKQLNMLDMRPGTSASERARLNSRAAQGEPKVDDGSVPGRVQLSRQAQRMTEEFGRVNPAFMTSVAAGGAGASYGFTQGETPEERAANALKFGILGLGTGAGAAMLLPRPGQPLRPTNASVAVTSAGTAKFRAHLDSLAKGTDGMPEWYLRFRTAEPIVKLRETLVNSRARVKDVVAAAPGDVAEDANPYLAGKLFPGRVAGRIRIEAEEAVQAAVWNREKAADVWSKATGGSSENFNARLNEFMAARTARDYNREHAEFTAETGRPAAGMTDVEADATIERARRDGVFEVFEDLRQQVRAIDETVLDVLEDGQLLSARQAETLRKKYPEHVPLNRIMPEADDEAIVGAVFGVPRFLIRSAGVKEGHGSNRQIDDIYASVLTNLKDAIIRAERNKVALSAVAFFRQHPLEGVTVKRPKVIGNDGEFPIYERPDNNLTLAAREVADGGQSVHPIWVEFADPLMARAFNGQNVEQTGQLLRWLGRATRLMAGLYTRFNLGFIPANKMRDLQEATVVAATSGDWRAPARILASSGRDMAAVSSALLGRDSPGAELYHQALLDGAFTGGLASSTRASAERTVQQMSRRGAVMRGGDAVIGFFDFLNGVMEDSTRLSAYRLARDSSASPALAALASREIGVDFNMKGTLTAQIGSLYAFVNPGIQGAVRAGKALVRNPKAIGAAAVSFMGAGAAVDAWNRSIDPDWKRRRQMQVYRAYSLPLILGDDDDGYYVLTLPVAQMLRPLKALVDIGLDLNWGDLADGADVAERARQALAESMNPLGGQSLRQALAPTIADPISDVLANESFTGSRIVPLGRVGDPQFAKVYPSTPETASGRAAMAAARILARIGVDVSPQSLLYLARGYAGGPGEVLQQAANLATSTRDGAGLTTRDIPIVGRFVRYVPKSVPLAEPGAQRLIDEERTRSADSRLALEQRARSLRAAIPAMTTAEKRELVRSLQENPRLRDALDALLTRESEDSTPIERQAAALTVNDGTRARFVYRYLRSIPITERRAAYDRLRAQRILTPEVEQQVVKLTAED